MRLPALGFVPFALVLSCQVQAQTLQQAMQAALLQRLKTEGAASPADVVLLVGTVLLVGLLNYVPALALGPVVEHLMLWPGK